MTAKYRAQGAGSRRAACAIALAVLLTVMFAARADARVWLESDPGLNPLEWVVGSAGPPAITIHNDTDTELTLSQFLTGIPPLTFRPGGVAACIPLPAHGQCVLTGDLTISGQTSSQSGTWEIAFTTPGGAEVKADPFPWSITSHVFGVTPESRSAGSQTVGTVGPAFQVTADVPLGGLDPTFTRATLAGANPDDFLITRDGCFGPQPNPSTCDIAVRFFPQAPGRRTATLVLATTYANTITGATASDSRSVPLEGTGVAAAPPGIQTIPGPQSIQVIRILETIPATPTRQRGTPVCRSVTATRVLCDGLLDPAGTTAQIARVDIRRDRTVYATGKGRTLKVLRRVRAGTYTLVLLRRTRSGKIHKTIWRVQIG